MIEFVILNQFDILTKTTTRRYINPRHIVEVTPIKIGNEDGVSLTISNGQDIILNTSINNLVKASSLFRFKENY